MLFLEQPTCVLTVCFQCISYYSLAMTTRPPPENTIPEEVVNAWKRTGINLHRPRLPTHRANHSREVLQDHWSFHLVCQGWCRQTLAGGSPMLAKRLFFHQVVYGNVGPSNLVTTLPLDSTLPWSGVRRPTSDAAATSSGPNGRTVPIHLDTIISGVNSTHLETIIPAQHALEDILFKFLKRGFEDSIFHGKNLELPPAWLVEEMF